ncbi:hypothetical protein EVAR_17772_1 [Eumeta japonica]|uniref:Uncharacterized protein n=1 Tax=Eumeta variegata TaxID=151549 RepID=A0A4C1TTE0_EUMVA|nr:hypothetical protein EVAR_17772_1 [Eumeta japonica]
MKEFIQDSRGRSRGYIPPRTIPQRHRPERTEQCLSGHTSATFEISHPFHNINGRVLFPCIGKSEGCRLRHVLSDHRPRLLHSGARQPLRYRREEDVISSRRDFKIEVFEQSPKRPLSFRPMSAERPMLYIRSAL